MSHANRVKLEGAAKTEALAKVPAWTSHDANGDKTDRISQDFTFKSFVTAFSFMTQVALLAEKVCTAYLTMIRGS